ncbi:hypothetical protein ElyMa_005526200 [Elysia marginata]|uniref:Uncharacterized protein n=1 Tax=Elysia marginata TaxID=1093978 RepID=A0AAV4EW43_9GAST|nr:hypothetical protein ElyMa_005526200 [Elysia marginata]
MNIDENGKKGDDGDRENDNDDGDGEDYDAEKGSYDDDNDDDGDNEKLKTDLSMTECNKTDLYTIIGSSKDTRVVQKVMLPVK